SIYAGGGFAESAEWVQMLADICGLPVQVPATVETSALGAVMIGAKATGHANVASSKNNLTVYMPKAASHQIYQKVFLQYNEALKNLGLLKKPLE
ncbi:FGGY-family carbohydrate kinase, partial [Streptomyces sp. UMAF16]|nr:FGGY-family carbohydrate kinase [Streptomyces sp. UMAF16]